MVTTGSGKDLNLIAFTYTGREVIPEVLDELRLFPEVERVDFHRTTFDDSHAEIFIKLGAIRELNLYYTRIALGTIKIILEHCPGLTDLNLGWTNVPPGALTSIDQLNQLHTLDVSGITLNPADRAAIARCPKLRRLSIINTTLDATTLAPLLAIASLEELTIDAQALGPDPLSIAPKLLHLKKLRLTDLQWHPGQFTQLKQALPQCEITTDD